MPPGSGPAGRATERLFYAIRQDDAELLASLLASGADPNAANAAGQRPLHIAAANGNLQIIEALLRSGGKLLPDAQGKSPELYALMAGQTEAFKALLAADYKERGSSAEAAAEVDALLTDQGPAAREFLERTTESYRDGELKVGSCSATQVCSGFTSAGHIYAFEMMPIPSLLLLWLMHW